MGPAFGQGEQCAPPWDSVPLEGLRMPMEEAAECSHGTGPSGVHDNIAKSPRVANSAFHSKTDCRDGT